jgi:flagellar basal-body rod protein FlgF
MTRLIDHSRSFEANMKVIKEAKSLDESGASMMRAS